MILSKLHLKPCQIEPEATCSRDWLRERPTQSAVCGDESPGFARPGVRERLQDAKGVSPRSLTGSRVPVGSASASRERSRLRWTSGSDVTQPGLLRSLWELGWLEACLGRTGRGCWVFKKGFAGLSACLRTSGSGVAGNEEETRETCSFGNCVSPSRPDRCPRLPSGTAEDS